MPYGFVTRVTVQEDQTEVTAAALSGATSITVEWPDLFDAFGATVDVNGTFCAIDSVNEDTGVLTLLDPIPSNIDVGDPVYVVAGGQRRTHRIASVDLGEGDDADVAIPFGDRDLWDIGDYGDPVPVLLSADLRTILETPGRVPDREPSAKITAAITTSANGKNRITYATAAPTVNDANIVGDTWYHYNSAALDRLLGVYRGTGGTAGAYGWQVSQWEHQTIATMDAAKITTGTLDAQRIGAHTITADKMTVGVGENRIVNAGYEDNTTGVPHAYTSGATWNGIGTATPRSGTQNGRITMPALAAMTPVVVFNGSLTDPTKHPRVELGSQWHGYVWARRSTGTAGTARARLRVHDSAGTVIESATGSTVTLDSTWRQLPVDVTIAATAARYVTLTVDGNGTTAGDIWALDDAFLGQKSTGSLIVDGAIDGKTITGATLQTGSAGARVVVKDDSTTDDGTRGVVKIYTDTTWQPAEMYGKYDSGTTTGTLALRSPYPTGGLADRTKLELRSNTGSSIIWAQCDRFDINGELECDTLGVIGQADMDGLTVTGDTGMVGTLDVAGKITSRATFQAGAGSSGTFAAAGDVNVVAVTFDTSFNVAPAVTVTPSGGTDPKVLFVAATNITTTGFDLRCSRSTGTGSFSVSWIAHAKTQ